MKSFSYYFGLVVIILGIVSVLATAYQTFFLKNFEVISSEELEQ